MTNSFVRASERVEERCRRCNEPISKLKPFTADDLDAVSWDDGNVEVVEPFTAEAVAVPWRGGIAGKRPDEVVKLVEVRRDVWDSRDDPEQPTFRECRKHARTKDLPEDGERWLEHVRERFGEGLDHLVEVGRYELAGESEGERLYQRVDPGRPLTRMRLIIDVEEALAHKELRDPRRRKLKRAGVRNDRR